MMRLSSCLRLLLPTLLTACAALPELVPAPEARLAPGPAAGAVGEAAGVQVVARPDQWPGPAPIAMHVTPMRVTIENKGSAQVLIRYSEFVLEGPAGKAHSALPPFDIRGSVSLPVLGPGYGPILTPGVTASGFFVSPLYGSLYPGFPVMDTPFPYHPYYYDTFRDYWVRYELPTPDMVQFALPEGRLDPGGKVDGYLYFEKLEASAGPVEFRMNLVGAQDRQALGAVRIPFRLKAG